MRLVTLFLTLSLLLLFALTETGYAKHREATSANSCQKFYSASRHSEAPPELINAIGLYQKLMNLSEIGDRPEHLNAAKDALKNLSNTARKKIKRLIRENYTAVKQFKYSKNAPIKTLKRHFDFLLSLESNAYEFLSEQLSMRPQQWESILQIYYDKQAKMAGLPQPVDASNVLYIAYKIQETIKSESQFEKSSVVLYGSTINGRGLSGLSDLDYSVSDTVLLSKLESAALKFPELDKMSLSESEGHRMLPKQVHSYGYMNPIVIVVYSSYIELRVYKRLPYSDYVTNPEFYSHYAN